MFQRFGSSERREEGGGRGLRPGARPNIHGDIRQDCRQRGGGLHQHRQGDIRQDPGGSVRYQQRGEWYQDRASAQHRGRGLRGRGAGRSCGWRRLLLEASHLQYEAKRINQYQHTLFAFSKKCVDQKH